MLIIKVDSGIEKALKLYKKKYDKTKVLKNLRDRKSFTKKSIKRRSEINKAIYINKEYGIY